MTLFQGLISTYQKLTLPSNKSFYLSILRLYVAGHVFRNTLVHWGNMHFTLGEDSIYPMYYTNVVILWARDNYDLFVFVMLSCCIIFFFGIGKHLGAILLFSVVEIYNDLVPYLLNGGDNLLKFLIFYLIFADCYAYFSVEKLKIKNAELRKVSNFLTNIAVYCILVHLCLIYFKAGIEKANADEWYNGVALYYILNIERFTGTPLNTLLSKNGYLINLATYAVILWELYFPVLVWIKKVRLPLIIFGVFMHLGIMILMMLYDFQLLFIAVYGLFFTNREWFAALGRVKDMFRRDSATVSQELETEPIAETAANEIPLL